VHAAYEVVRTCVSVIAVGAGAYPQTRCLSRLLRVFERVCPPQVLGARNSLDPLQKVHADARYKTGVPPPPPPTSAELARTAGAGAGAGASGGAPRTAGAAGAGRNGSGSGSGDKKKKPFLSYFF
jgi:hypothetical protein